MPLLKTDGTEMKLNEIADLLTLAAKGGSRPEEVSWSAWLDALERVWQDAENELDRAFAELRRVEERVKVARKERDFHHSRYFDARASNDQAHGSAPATRR